MAARIYTLLTHSLVHDHGWSLHRPGCAGIQRDVQEHGSEVEPHVVIDLDDEDAMMRAIDVDGLGYSSMDVKVHSCCDTAPHAEPAPTGDEPPAEIADCGDTSAHEPHDGMRARPNGRPGGLDMTPIRCPGRPGADDACPKCSAVSWAVTPAGADECTACGYVDEPAVPLADALAGAEAKRQARGAGWLPALGATTVPTDTREWGVRP